MQDADGKPGDVQAGASDPAFVSPYVLAAPPEVGVSVGTFCGRDSYATCAEQQAILINSAIPEPRTPTYLIL